MMTTQRPFLGQIAWRPAAPRRPYLGGASLGAATALTDATFAQALAAPRAVIDFWSPG